MKDEISLRDQANTACIAAVPDVLETMFFELLVESPEVGWPAPLEVMESSRVNFEGSACGCLTVAAASNLAESLAKAFLGLEDQGAAGSNIEFVLGELANMLCGSTLGRFQPEGTFRLTTPVTHHALSLAEQGEPDFPWIRFSLDSGPLLVGLKLESSE